MMSALKHALDSSANWGFASQRQTALYSAIASQQRVIYIQHCKVMTSYYIELSSIMYDVTLYSTVQCHAYTMRYCPVSCPYYIALFRVQSLLYSIDTMLYSTIQHHIYTILCCLMLHLYYIALFRVLSLLDSISSILYSTIRCHIYTILCCPLSCPSYIVQHSYYIAICPALYPYYIAQHIYSIVLFNVISILYCAVQPLFHTIQCSIYAIWLWPGLLLYYIDCDHNIQRFLVSFKYNLETARYQAIL